MSRERRSDRRLQPSSSQAATRLASERPLKPPRQMPRRHGRVRSQWLGDTRVPSVSSMLDLAIEWKPESRVLSRSRERSPHRFAHRGMSRRPNVEGDESEVRYPAAEERGLAATNRAAGRMLLTDFCNHPLQNENPKIVRFSSARLSPGRLRARDPNALKRTEHRVHGALTHLAARQPRVEGRLTTRFQLRLARHRPRTSRGCSDASSANAAPRHGFFGHERGRTSTVSDALVARRRSRYPKAPRGRRKARTESLALTSMRAKYPGSGRLPPTRRSTKAHRLRDGAFGT